MKRKTLIVGNWKMKPSTKRAAEDIFRALVKGLPHFKKSTIVICPPFVFLGHLRDTYSGAKIRFGAQDVFWEKDAGAYTGEVSARQLASSDIDYVLVGHSERRTLGETDSDVAKKIKAALAAGLTTILCIGERERDTHGGYLAFLEAEIRTSLAGVSRERAGKGLIVAYEPIWAIGKTARDAMTPRDIHQTTLFIRKVLAKIYGKKVALDIPILYGGSVEPDNAGMILTEGHVDGFLVGHESIDPEAFHTIIRVAETVKRT